MCTADCTRASAFPWASRAKAQSDLRNHQASYELLGPGLLIGASPSLAGYRRQAAYSADRQGCYRIENGYTTPAASLWAKEPRPRPAIVARHPFEPDPVRYAQPRLLIPVIQPHERRAQNVSKPQFPLSTSDKRKRDVLTIHAGASPARLAGNSWRLLPCCTSVDRCQNRPFSPFFTRKIYRNH